MTESAVFLAGFLLNLCFYPVFLIMIKEEKMRALKMSALKMRAIFNIMQAIKQSEKIRVFLKKPGSQRIPLPKGNRFFF